MVNSVPKIAVYISGLELDRDRLADASYVGKLNFRERDTTGGNYNQSQGRNYTVERLMPTPFKLTLKADIWSSSTDQKLQIAEQILVLFNPSLELQTSDNYVDWTSLTVLNLSSTSWTSRQVPVGTDTPIDICTLTFETPIWISPPVKVKHLGVITKIITNLWGNSNSTGSGYIEGLGYDTGGGDTTFGDLLSTDATTIGGYSIQVYNGQAVLLPHDEVATPVNWEALFDQYPGKFVAGSSQIYLIQRSGTAIIGTVAINPLDASILNINYDPDTLVSNTGIDSTGKMPTDPGYNAAGSYRPNSPGTFDAIVNPQSFDPGTIAAGTRYLLVEDIGNVINTVPAEAWGNLVAHANDIIEWTGSSWNVIFHAAQESDTMVWQTNIYTNVQYLWNGVSWVKSFDGVYGTSQWKIIL